MLKVILWLAVIWGLVIATLLFMGAISRDMNSLADEAVTEMEATVDLDNYPGTGHALQSFSVWKWFIPPVVGLILTGIVLKKYRDEQQGE